VSDERLELGPRDEPLVTVVVTARSYPVTIRFAISGAERPE